MFPKLSDFFISVYYSVWRAEQIAVHLCFKILIIIAQADDLGQWWESLQIYARQSLCEGGGKVILSILLDPSVGRFVF